MSTRPRILLTRRWTREVETHLAARYEVTCNESDVPLTAAALRAAMQEYDATRRRGRARAACRALERLARMMSTAVLINTARGPVVDEGALVAALSQGRIAAAGLDAYAAP